MMAHITDWTLEIVGRGGHGSIPHVSGSSGTGLPLCSWFLYARQ